MDTGEFRHKGRVDFGVRLNWRWLMLIGAAEFELFLPMCHSLKEKRGLIKSLQAKLRNKFNAAVCEAADQDLWQRCVIGVAVVSNDSKHIDSMFAAITKFMDGFSDEVQVIGVTKEIL